MEKHSEMPRVPKRGINAAKCLLLFIALTIAGVSEDFELLHAMVTAVAVICAGISILVRLVSVRGPTKLAWFTYIAAIALLSFLAAKMIVSGLVENTQKIAGALIQALERYRATHGAFPENLAELVPAEMPALPKTGAGIYGKDFWYSKGTDRFTLGFQMRARLMYSYDSKTGEWIYYD